MRSSIVAIALSLVCCAAGSALAEDGKIVWVDPSCKFFIAQVGDEYGIFEWRSGADPEHGDALSGLVPEEGMRKVTNSTKGGSNDVIIVARGSRLKTMINSTPVQCKLRWKQS